MAFEVIDTATGPIKREDVDTADGIIRFYLSPFPYGDLLYFFRL